VRRLAALAAFAVSLLAVLGLTGTAHAATSYDRGSSVLAAAETRTGDWYVYGGAGPTVFDCSGLLFWSAHQVGINMPRDTEEMLTQGIAGGLLVRTYHPVAGDAAFYGWGHVEIVARGHDVTFGAQQPGTRVGYHHWNGWWHPTMYFQIR
jgi:cell wall-associated NlpC family hydrolase